jgi:hypothetical protein
MKYMPSNFVATFRTIYRNGILSCLFSRYSAALHLYKTSGDVDDFLSFSLSVQNRRKSRVGLALENHLELLFTECGIQYKRTAVTENKAKPDFIFPSDAAYHDPAFDVYRLTMLGVKSALCRFEWNLTSYAVTNTAQWGLLKLDRDSSHEPAC